MSPPLPPQQSLCRDLDKEGTKAWLDMMLEKLSTHSSENEENLSGRDKAMKAQEKKKLEAMIERHKGLMGPTMEAQSMWTPRLLRPSFPSRGGCGGAALSLSLLGMSSEADL